MRTKDCRPWWWWINPWLYIKRRDIAYDTALDIIAWQGKSIGRKITPEDNRRDLEIAGLDMDGIGPDTRGLST